MSTWPTAQLSDVADINPRLSTMIRPDEVVSFVPMSAVSAEKAAITSEATRYYADVAKGFTSFVDGDVLVAKITPCFENGKIAQASLPRQGFGSTEFHVVRPRHAALDGRYVLHFLRQGHIRLAGERRMTGSAGQRRVPEHFLSGLRVPLPPLGEQRRIAAILDKADALRAKRRAALGELDTLTQSIFLEMFGDLTTNPKRWPERLVADYVEAFQGGKSIDAESGENVTTKNRILKVSAVTGMKFVAEESKPIPDQYEAPAEHFVRTGDLLFTRANTSELVGAVAFVNRCQPNLLLPDKIWRFVWRTPIIVEPLFVWALFQTPRMRYEIGRRATGTSGSMKNISQEKVLGIKTIVPPLTLQRNFSRRLTAVGNLRVQQAAAAAALESLFASLQHRAFRGEL